jgi:hypothetical protein
LRVWVETSNPNARWGFIDPTTGYILALKKRDLSYYGKVSEVEDEKPTINVETKVEMGTPSLGVIDEEE